MTVDLKPLEDQVVVITGATSGIGLTTARMAADRGASVVLAARSEDELEALTDEITENGGDAVHVVADVRDRGDVEGIAAAAEETYGGFDTWVNNAGAFIYGRLRETPVEEMRALFETNVWGLLYGSLVAADHLEDRGGAIVNVGSVVSDRAVILQGAYSASKQAVKGFTDTLRMELEEEGAPVSVTLIKPAGIDTPYPEHAKNYTDSEATLPPPVYAPETAARAILHAAAEPERDLFVGGGAKNMAQLEYYVPDFLDSIMEKFYVGLQQKDSPPRPLEQNTLDGPTGEPEAGGARSGEPGGDESDDGVLEARGGYEGHVAKRSLYTRTSMRGLLPKVATIGLGAVGMAVYARYRARREREESDGSMIGEIVDRTESAVEGLRSQQGEESQDLLE